MAQAFRGTFTLLKARNLLPIDFADGKKCPVEKCRGKFNATPTRDEETMRKLRSLPDHTQVDCHNKEEFGCTFRTQKAHISRHEAECDQVSFTRCVRCKAVPSHGAIFLCCNPNERHRICMDCKYLGKEFAGSPAMFCLLHLFMHKPVSCSLSQSDFFFSHTLPEVQPRVQRSSREGLEGGEQAQQAEV